MTPITITVDRPSLAPPPPDPEWTPLAAASALGWRFVLQCQGRFLGGQTPKNRPRSAEHTSELPSATRPSPDPPPPPDPEWTPLAAASALGWRFVLQCQGRFLGGQTPKNRP